MKNRNLKHSDNWGTPEDLYQALDLEFGFDFDPTPLNHDTSKWCGLEVEWGEVNFVNPPYSRKLKEAFIKKAVEESKKGKQVVMLLPVSTSTRVFHEEILPNKKEIRFIRGRVKFEGYNTKGEYTTKSNGMHDSMIVIL